MYVYVGEKKATGNPAERAGLTGGKLFGVKVAGVPLEPVNTGVPSGTAFTAVDLGDVKNKTGAQLQAESVAAGVTEWQRPEDASWDPKHPNDLYFAITSSFTTQSKLYRLRFVDPANPAAGGKVDQLLDGTENGGTAERFHMLDNITVDTRGHVMLQEDPGNQAYLARIWQYDIKRDALTEVATFDPALFTPGAAELPHAGRGVDRESSTPSDILGQRLVPARRAGAQDQLRSRARRARAAAGAVRARGRGASTTTTKSGTAAEPPRERGPGASRRALVSGRGAGVAAQAEAPPPACEGEERDREAERERDGRPFQP